MKILHIYKDYRPVIGGIENHTRLLARAQADAGHEVSVLVCAKGFKTRVLDEDGIRVIKTGRLATVASMPLSLRLPLALRNFHPDIVHIHSPFPLGEIANWLFHRGSSTVITHHSDIVRQKRLLWFYGPLLKRVLAAADGIIATSPPYLESSPWLGPVRSSCKVVPLGVDLELFKPPAGKKPPEGLRQLLFVGCLRYYKGLQTLLEAMTSIPDSELTVVGDGPMRVAWEQTALRLGLSERVHFTGQVSDEALLKQYARADLFVLPANARSEAFGTVLLEAMACGLPLISTELGTGTSWVNQDGVTGKVVPPKDAKKMAETINALLDDSDRLMEMGRAARRRVEQDFSLKQMVQGVESVYQSVLKKASPGKEPIGIDTRENETPFSPPSQS